MNRLKITALAASALILFGCNSHKNDYTLSVSVPEELNGQTVYLLNFDTKEKIDSVTAADGVALFQGTVDTPILVRLTAGGSMLGTIVLEPGQIEMSEGDAKGTPLNDLSNELSERMTEFTERYNAADSLDQVTIENEYNAFVDSVTNANLDNPLGYYFFLQKAYEMELDEIEQAVAEHPSLGDYTRVQSLIAGAKAKAETSAGKPMKDFEVVTSSGETVKLSDYVGKGKPVLVDFWASWCGPCIRETKVIKKLLEEYGPQGLEVLGVAVWDEPENTADAVARHQLPWPQIDNAQNIPTDLYGIPAIPCIIIFSPDGMILSRGKQGEELAADVKAVMEGTLSEATFAPSEE